MRKINELIWHCSATPEGRKVSVATIRKWHKARGWSDIGYHKVVYLDGSVHDGRPMSRIGAHVKGHNTGSLGYCYVGGTDKDGVAKDTRTEAQKIAMARLTREAIAHQGVTKVTGHNEYANKACPSFNVQTDKTIRNAVKGLPHALRVKTLPKSQAAKGVVPAFLAIVAAVIAFITKQLGVW